MTKRPGYLLLLSLLVSSPAFCLDNASSSEFRDPTPAERAMTSVSFAPGAPAVVLNWDQFVQDRDGYRSEYVRIKILSGQGQKYALIPPREQLAGKTHRAWNDVAAWYMTLTTDRTRATPSLGAKALELTNGKTSVIEKVAAIGAFTQHGVRYVAIEIGLGGPHYADDIFTNRYGDCKDNVMINAEYRPSFSCSSPVHEY